MKFFILGQYLGDKLIQELTLPDDEPSANYIKCVSIDTVNHPHPQVRTEILTLELTDTQIVRPANPMELAEFIG